MAEVIARYAQQVIDLHHRIHYFKFRQRQYSSSSVNRKPLNVQAVNINSSPATVKVLEQNNNNSSTLEQNQVISGDGITSGVVCKNGCVGLKGSVRYCCGVKSSPCGLHRNECNGLNGCAKYNGSKNGCVGLEGLKQCCDDRILCAKKCNFTGCGNHVPQEDDGLCAGDNLRVVSERGNNILKDQFQNGCLEAKRCPIKRCYSNFTGCDRNIQHLNVLKHPKQGRFDCIDKSRVHGVRSCRNVTCHGKYPCSNVSSVVNGSTIEKLSIENKEPAYNASQSKYPYLYHNESFVDCVEYRNNISGEKIVKNIASKNLASGNHASVLASECPNWKSNAIESSPSLCSHLNNNTVLLKNFVNKKLSTESQLSCCCHLNNNSHVVRDSLEKETVTAENKDSSYNNYVKSKYPYFYNNGIIVDNSGNTAVDCDGILTGTVECKNDVSASNCNEANSSRRKCKVIYGTRKNGAKNRFQLKVINEAQSYKVRRYMLEVLSTFCFLIAYC